MVSEQDNPLSNDIYDFLREHENTRVPPAAIGSSGFTPYPQTPQSISIPSAHSGRRPETRLSSKASSETRRSSIFDSVGSLSSTSTLSVVPGRRLPCEFHWYADCEETFDPSDTGAWMNHNATHLEMIFPTKCRCWFCDRVLFWAESDTPQHRQDCYTARMNHIAVHYHHGATLNDVRPDFDFLDHLRENDLISRRDFHRAKNFHEAPQPRNGINSEPVVRRVDWEAVVEVRSRPRGRRESHTRYRP